MNPAHKTCSNDTFYHLYVVCPSVGPLLLNITVVFTVADLGCDNQNYTLYINKLAEVCLKKGELSDRSH